MRTQQRPLAGDTLGVFQGRQEARWGWSRAGKDGAVEPEVSVLVKSQATPGLPAEPRTWTAF